jgi:hypothetical protein
MAALLSQPCRMATAAYKQDPENPCACTSLATYYLNHWMPTEIRVQRVAADPKHCTLHADVTDLQRETCLSFVATFRRIEAR